jgi:hypothetical protein
MRIQENQVVGDSYIDIKDKDAIKKANELTCITRERHMESWTTDYANNLT